MTENEQVKGWSIEQARELDAALIQTARDLAGGHGATQGEIREARAGYLRDWLNEHMPQSTPIPSEGLIANLTYKGNSVTWWHSKAENYKAALARAWDTLIENGINPDGKTDVAAAIRAIGQNANGKTRNEQGKPDTQPVEKA